MIDYADIAAGALTAIQEAGATVVISRFAEAYDPVTGESIATLDVTGTFAAVILPAKKANAIAGFQVGFDNSYAEKLRAGKVRALLIAATGAPFAPKQGDVATFAGQDWELLGCTSLNPALTVPIIYKVEVASK